MRYYGHIPASQKSYVCMHVFNNERPILLVDCSHGDWSLLCGDEHEPVASNFRVVGIGHLFDRDPTLLSLVDLPAEWEARRKSVQDRWVQTPSQAPE
jgi:hypothetical protein